MKVLFPEIAQDRVAAARFRNEISASYGVSHPHVIRAYEYVRDGDLVAYTMEYVGGGDLAERLGRTDEIIPIPECVRIFAQMCSGVQAIHDAGIVHRDLKPENIFLTKDNTVKIGDFGIARAGSGPRLTEHGGVVGTIEYVSPEYMLNSQVDWRSDIYAMGILAFEMVTREAPFTGDTVYAKMTKRLRNDPPPPSQFRPECPKELDKIILRAMARNPDERFQSAAEILFELQALMPDAVGNAAAFVSMTQKASKDYTGPVLNQQPSGATDIVRMAESEVEEEGPAEEPAVAGPGRVPSYEENDEESVPMSNRSRVATEMVDDTDSLVSSGRTQYEDALVVEPQKVKRLESVLAGRHPGANSGAAARDVEVSRGAIDNNRFKALSESASKSNTKGLPEWLLPVLALTGGLAAAIFGLQFVLPEVYASILNTLFSLVP
jgi:serine/threonine-protein kinase